MSGKIRLNSALLLALILFQMTGAGLAVGRSYEEREWGLA